MTNNCKESKNQPPPDPEQKKNNKKTKQKKKKKGEKNKLKPSRSFGNTSGNQM